MKPTLCSKCKKNLAVVFITKIENGETINEGYCLKCAKELGIKPVDDMISRMGLSDEDLESISGEMLGAMNGLEGLMANAQNQDDDTDDEDDDNASQTATFPFLNKLFGTTGNNGGNTSGEALTPQNEEPRQTPPRGDSPLREDGKRSCLEQCFCGVKPPLQQEARASCGRAVPTRGCRTALCP